MTQVPLEHFPELEGSGLAPKLLILLQALRYMTGLPIVVTSGFRPDDTDSAHSDGTAVDISDNASGAAISAHWRHETLKALYALGFERIGDYDRHIHFDISTVRPQKVTWWAESS